MTLYDTLKTAFKNRKYLFKAYVSKYHCRNKEDKFGIALHEAGHAVVHLAHFPNSDLFLHYDNTGAACRFEIKDAKFGAMSIEDVVGMMAFTVAGISAEVLHGNTYEDIAFHCEADQAIFDTYIFKIKEIDLANNDNVLMLGMIDYVKKITVADLIFPDDCNLETQLQVLLLQHTSELLVKYDFVYKEIANQFLEQTYLLPSQVTEIWSRREVN